MLTLPFIIAFLILGAVVGFMAGLLGIGGGAIMVPILTSLFLAMGMPFDQVVHLALGTSMAAIIGTSFSSMWSYHKKQAVLWPVLRAMLPGVMVGTYCAAYIVHSLNPLYLTSFFALFMFFVALQMFFIHPTVRAGHLPKKGELLLAGFGIGSISTLVSIGGGSLTVPYLTLRHLGPLNSIATSAALGFPISVFATLGYIVHGWDTAELSSGIVGSIYLPALLLVSAVSYFFAPLGVKYAHQLPTKTLKRCFALLAFGLSGLMFYDVFTHV